MCLLIAESRNQNRSLRFSPIFFILTALYFLFLGSFLVSRSLPRFEKGHYNRFYIEGERVQLLVQSRLSESPDRSRYEARVISVGSEKTRGRIWLTLTGWEGPAPVDPGDTLYTGQPFDEIRPPPNPGGFDFRGYASKKGMIHQVHLRQGEFLHLPGRPRGIRQLSSRINERLQHSLEKNFQDTQALAVAKALLLGSRDDISPELMTYFKGAGAAHILAISGLHVGTVLLLLMFVTRPITYIKGSTQIRIGLVVVGLWGYALITGMSVSVLRAVSMFTLIIIGRWWNRDTSLFRNLILSAFVLLIVNPMFAFDVGFQLSYSALAGIAVAAPWTRRLASGKPGAHKYFLELLLISCSAQLGVLPLSLLYFNQFSGLFLISSVILLPSLGMTLFAGYFLLALSTVADPPYLMTLLFEKWMGLLNGLVIRIGAIDGLIFRDLYFPLSFCFLTYLLFLALYRALVGKRMSSMLVFGGLIVFLQGLWLHKRIEVLREEELVVFQLYKESFILRRSGREVEYPFQAQGSERSKRLIREYKSTLPGSILKFGPETETEGRERLFFIGSTLVCVIESSVSPTDLPVRPEIVVLVDSPGINLDRLLSEIRPRVVVADGSNYPSHVQRWRESCASQEVIFHSTASEGAFVYP